MKLNLLIRTYIVDKLYISLFDIPSKIDSSHIEIYVHNDNPNAIQPFNSIIEEFRLKYPNYIIHTIQEVENQDMFMSYINSIEYLNPNNYWTMMLDDDDTLCSSNVIDFLNKYKDVNTCIRYKIYCVTKNNKYCSYFLWHRIYQTESLKKLFGYKGFIIEALIKHNKTTKFNNLEDELFCNIMKELMNLDVITFETPLVNYNIYDHNINGYEHSTLTNTRDAWKRFKDKIKIRCTINNIIHELKGKIYEHTKI